MDQQQHASGQDRPDRDRANSRNAATLPVSPRVASILSEVAEQLKDQADDIALTMVEVYKVEIPAYSAIEDDALLEDVHSVSSAMVRCWLAVMSGGARVSDDQLEPLWEGARRRAAQDFDLQSLLRAFRIGIRVMWSEITASSIWRGKPLQAAMADVATWVLDFADQISTGVAAAFVAETDRATREEFHRRSALLNVILAGPGSGHIDGPDDLSETHCVLVARARSDLSLAQLEETAELIEERVDALLWTIRYCSIVAAVRIRGSADRLRLRQQMLRMAQGGRILAVGVGGCAEGVLGTRQSYSEAVDALRIGPHLGATGQPFYEYHELAPMAALLADRERALRFAASALTPLGELLEHGWVLPTLEAYLVRQGRLKEIAAALSVHPSTVKYRLGRLREFLDTSAADGDKAATLLLALRVHHLLADEETTASPLSALRTHDPPASLPSTGRSLARRSLPLLSA